MIFLIYNKKWVAKGQNENVFGCQAWPVANHKAALCKAILLVKSRQWMGPLTDI